MRSGGAMRVCVLLLATSGCGLGFDLGPQSTGSADAGRRGMDGGTRDGSAPDSGPPEGCTTQPECDDEDACNGVEMCLEGVCVPGEAIECDDGDPCNGVETCDEEGECSTSPSVPCDDGVYCNGREACVPFLGCQVVEPVVCDDGVACTVDSCNEDMTTCEHVPMDALCTAAPSGSCNSDFGCQYDNCTATCMPSNACEMANCSGTLCVRVSMCLAGEPCCDGACGCDDGNPCTYDSCGPMGCIHSPVMDGDACDDGDMCTVGDRCVAGTCTAGSFRTCGDGDPCTMDVCSSTAGCMHPPAADGTACDDGDGCTSGDICRGGTCRSGSPVSCDDGNPCTTNSCSAGLCVSARLPPGTPCPSLGVDYVCSPAAVCRCPALRLDCDMNGTCECREPRSCSAGTCADVAPPCSAGSCPRGQLCCVTDGVCYAMSCLGCCMAVIP